MKLKNFQFYKLFQIKKIIKIREIKSEEKKIKGLL
jgi:hypothetical protein